VVFACQRNVQRIRRTSFRVGVPQMVAIIVWSSVISMLLAKEVNQWFAMFGYVVIACGLLALGIIDAVTHRVPRYINGLIITIAVPFIVLDALVNWDLANLLRAGAGAVALFVVYIVIGVASRGGFGKGDVLLAPVVGFALAYRDWSTLLTGTALTFIIAGVASAVLLATKRVGRRDHIAFGPYIAAGTLLSLIF